MAKVLFSRDDSFNVWPSFISAVIGTLGVTLIVLVVIVPRLVEIIQLERLAKAQFHAKFFSANSFEISKSDSGAIVFRLGGEFVSAAQWPDDAKSKLKQYFGSGRADASYIVNIQLPDGAVSGDGYSFQLNRYVEIVRGLEDLGVVLKGAIPSLTRSAEPTEDLLVSFSPKK